MTRISARPAAIPARPALRRAMLFAALVLALLLAGCVPQAGDRADGGSAAPSTSASESPQDSPEDAEPCEDDSYDYVALEMISCAEAQEAVRGVADNGRKTHISVEDGKTACTPGNGRWTCTKAGEQSPLTIEVEAKDEDDDPLADAMATTPIEPGTPPSDTVTYQGPGTYEQVVPVDCSKGDYDFVQLSDIGCSEAADVLQVFVDREAEGTLDDVRCTQGADRFDDGTREAWSCLWFDAEEGTWSFFAFGR